jgi:hypothetical protein
MPCTRLPICCCCCCLGATELLYARNSKIYVVLVKQRNLEGRLPDPKLIFSCVLLVTNSWYHSVDGNLHVQGARFLSLRCCSELAWSWPKRDHCWFEAESWVWPTWEKHRHASSCSRCGKNKMVDHTLRCMCWNKGNVGRCIFVLIVSDMVISRNNSSI